MHTHLACLVMLEFTAIIKINVHTSVLVLEVSIFHLNHTYLCIMLSFLSICPSLMQGDIHKFLIFFFAYFLSNLSIVSSSWVQAKVYMHILISILLLQLTLNLVYLYTARMSYSMTSRYID